MKAEDSDQFLELALLIAQKGYTIVAFETNGTDISLRLQKSEKTQKSD
jgi:hypothetical protein